MGESWARRGPPLAARRACRASHRQMVRRGPAGGRRHLSDDPARGPEDDGPRRPDPDLRHAGLGIEHRGRPRRPARPRLRRILRRRRLFLRAAQHAIRAGLLVGPAARRHDGGKLRPAAGFSRAAPARRLSRHRHHGVRRDHPAGSAELGGPQQRAGRNRQHSRSHPVRGGVRGDRAGRQADLRRDDGHPVLRQPAPHLSLLHHPGPCPGDQLLHPARPPPARRPGLGGAARGRDGLQGARHQSHQHQAHRLRGRRDVRGLCRLVLRRQAALHQPGKLHLHRIRRSFSPSSCWAGWAARSASCWPRCC